MNQRRAFSLARASGYRMFAVLIMIVLVLEGVPVHLLFARWSHVAAWIFTALGIYSFVWIANFYRSLAVRPVLVGNDSVLVQVGTIWRVDFPRSRVRAFRRFMPSDAPEGKRDGYVSLVVINDPQWLIEFDQPVAVEGPMGVRKMATRIALAVDDAEGFAAAMQSGTEPRP